MRSLPPRLVRVLIVLPFVMSLLACGLVSGSSVVSDTSLTPGAGGTTTPTTTPFALDSASVAPDPGNFSSGTCGSSVTFHFTATLTASAGNPGGAVSYQWISSGGSYAVQTLTFAPGDTTHTLTLDRSLNAGLGNGHTYWVAMQITAPNALTSAHANYTFECQFEPLGVTAAVSPSQGACTIVVCPTQTFTFTATVTVSPSPGGTVTYHWVHPDNTPGPDKTVSVPADASSIHVNDGESWTVHACDTYREYLVITAPDSLLSNDATFSVSC